MTKIGLIVSETMKSALRAAGVSPDLDELPRCELQVGDVLMYPGPAALALKVVSRFFSPGDGKREPRWYLELAPVPHPLAGPLSIELPRE
jgi:hypothetical protein